MYTVIIFKNSNKTSPSHSVRLLMKCSPAAEFSYIKKKKNPSDFMSVH